MFEKVLRCIEERLQYTMGNSGQKTIALFSKSEWYYNWKWTSNQRTAVKWTAETEDNLIWMLHVGNIPKKYNLVQQLAHQQFSLADGYVKRLTVTGELFSGFCFQHGLGKYERILKMQNIRQPKMYSQGGHYERICLITRPPTTFLI